MRCNARSAVVCAIVIAGIFGLSTSALWAQNPDDSGQPKSWNSATEQEYSGSFNPTRTETSFNETGNRKVETQSLERMNADGSYEPYLTVEKETTKADSNTVRTMERSYVRDSDGHRQLIQVTERESRTLADGEVKSVRTTSNPDANGILQVVQKEIEDKKQVSPGVQDTKTSLFTANIDGGLKESVRTERRDTQNDHTVEFKETNLIQDSNGNWQTREVKQGVVREDGKQSSREESVLRPDADGNLSVVQHAVSTETTGSGGETRATTETDSLDLPGVPRDGSLHPVERVTTVHRASQDGKQSTETQIERPNPGSPGDGMRVTSQSIDVVIRGANGISHQTRTLNALDANGDLSVVSVDFGRSDKPVQVSVAAQKEPGATQSPASQAAPKSAAPQPAAQPK
jgi:hypothetical protein